MQNTTFLVLLRSIFAPKMKIAPPNGIGEQNCEGLAGIWTRKLDFFSRLHLKLVRKTEWRSFFFFFFFFWDHLILAGKTVSILVKTFFILEITYLILTEKPPQSDASLMKIWVKFVYCCFQLPKKPPPLCEFLATRLKGGLDHLPLSNGCKNV